MFLILLSLVATIAMGGLAVGLARGGRDELDHHALLRGPATPIREVAENVPVKVVGHARAAGPLLAAPISGRACIAYQLEVRPFDEAWERVVVSLHGSDFFVDDDTGGVLVRSDGALLLLSEEGPDALVGTSDDPRCAALIERSGRAAEIADRWPGTKLHFVERVLTAGRLVAVAGAGLFEADPDPRAHHHYRELSRRIVLCAECAGALLISDDPTVAASHQRR